MPFISKDWRSPGEEWVKTEEGWEKKKILEFDQYYTRFRRYSDSESSEGERSDDEDREMGQLLAQTVLHAGLPVRHRPPAPHCQVTIKCTREVAGFNELSEACKRLDFRSAVRDIRRFHYVCKLLDLLITQNLTTLSGCAQKVMFAMLEEVAYQVSSNQQNIHILQKLLRDLKSALLEYYCWGRPLGSTVLWDQHRQTIDRIDTIANAIRIKQPEDEMMKLEDLPEECVREILLRLADHKDLDSSARAYHVMRNVLDEQRIWKELVQFHFSPAQISFTLNTEPALRETQDWQQIYHKLRRKYGLREDYAEILQLCRICRCLFWQSLGHPCRIITSETLDHTSSLHVPIPPQAFLKFFSL